MTGRSEFTRRDGAMIAWAGALAILLAFIVGLVQFVDPASSWHWTLSGALVLASMLSAGMWVEWWQR